MKISLITPTYNSAETLSRTIESVCIQNYPNLEYIIIDGGSSDNTKEVVEKYKDQINIIFVSEKDNGIYDAMNKGIKMAAGEIIGILNSDDLFDTAEVLKTVADAFMQEDIDAIYGDIVYFSTDVNKITRYWKSGKYNESNLNSGWTIPHPALFVKKNVYERCGYFKTTYKISADYEFILRILKIYKIKITYVPKVFVKMYNGGTSAKNLHNKKLGWQELKKSWADNNLTLPKFFLVRRIFYKIHQLLIRK